MDILPLNFRVLHFFGFWWEKDKQNWLVKYIWKPFVINVLFFFALLQFSALIFYENDTQEATKCLFVGLQFVSFSIKLTNILWRRERMVELLDKFRQGVCISRSEAESEVLQKHTKFIPLIFKFFVYVSYPTALWFCALPLFHFNEDTAKMDFPFKIYEIAGKDSVVYYVATYLFQILAFVIIIIVHSALDTMFCGFVLLTCAQIELCCHRLAVNCRNDVYNATKEYLAHRQLIVETAGHLESFFMAVILSFLFFSLITMCTSIYNLSQLQIASIESIAFIMYIGCLLVQVLLYCWFGNELTLKSVQMASSIYNSNWELSNSRGRKYLFYIMFASQKPLSLSFHGFCAVSMDVYVWVLKTSYAAYNLLQTVSMDDK